MELYIKNGGAIMSEGAMTPFYCWTISEIRNKVARS